VRRESSTVVVLVGEVNDRLLNGLAQSGNVSVARAVSADRPVSAAGVPVSAAGMPAWEAGALALREAAKLRSTYVVMADDPLAEVASSWQAMWELSGDGPAAAAEFEQHAGEVLAAWRARRFELPDYYLVVTRVRPVPEAGGPGAAEPVAVRPDLYLGPLRSMRSRRVALAVTDGQPPEIVSALRALQHGPWWPPLDELIDAARRFYPGALAQPGLATPSPPAPGLPASDLATSGLPVRRDGVGA
jgi:hypothetical protein